MPDPFDNWRMALSRTPGWWRDEPLCGFWRRKLRKGGAYQVVAIFHRGGEVVCVAGEHEVPWHHVWSGFIEPITEAEYRAVRKGSRFVDELRARDGGAHFVTDVRNAAAVLPPRSANAEPERPDRPD